MRRETLIKDLKNPKKELSEQTTPEPLKPLPSREPLPTLETYCQSKTFTAQTGINPLVTAASALFSLVTKLPENSDYPELDSLCDDLVHEIKAFECSAHANGYRSNEILIARFAICATLDEAIQNTPWGEKINWRRHNLLFIFQGEVWGGDSFFLILEKLSAEPNHYIELLEFMYLCLSLGFQGKYRLAEHEKENLDVIVDKLYQTIKTERGDFQTKLSAPYKNFQKPTQRKQHKLSTLSIACLASCLLLSVYIGINYLLGISTAPLETQLAQLTQTLNNETS